MRTAGWPCFLKKPTRRITFPHNAVSYVTGTDRNWGEGNPIFSSKFGQHYRRSDWIGVVAENPIYRTTDVIAHMMYGAVDLITAHLPHTLFNEKLGVDIPYFSPPVTTVREAARDLSMAAVIAATPAVKGRVIGKPVARPAPIEEIRPTANAKQVTPHLEGSMTPAFGLLTVAPGLIRIGRQISNMIARINPFSQFSQFNRLIKMVQEGNIDWKQMTEGSELDRVLATRRLVKLEETHMNAVETLSGLAKARPDLFSAKHIAGLIETAKTNENAAWLLRNLAEVRPDLFSAKHIAGLIETAKTNENAAWVLSDLAKAKPELALQIIPVLLEATKTNIGAKWALGDLGVARPELASQIPPGWIEVAKIRRRGIPLGDLAEAKPDLFPSQPK